MMKNIEVLKEKIEYYAEQRKNLNKLVEDVDTVKINRQMEFENFDEGRKKFDFVIENINQEIEKATKKERVLRKYKAFINWTPDGTLARFGKGKPELTEEEKEEVKKILEEE